MEIHEYTCNFCGHIHTHTHTRTRTHTRTHTHTLTNTHARARTHTFTVRPRIWISSLNSSDRKVCMTCIPPRSSTVLSVQWKSKPRPCSRDSRVMLPERVALRTFKLILRLFDHVDSSRFDHVDYSSWYSFTIIRIFPFLQPGFRFKEDQVSAAFFSLSDLKLNHIVEIILSCMHANVLNIYIYVSKYMYTYMIIYI